MYIIIVKAPFKSLCSSFYFFFWWFFGGKKFDEQKFLVHCTDLEIPRAYWLFVIHMLYWSWSKSACIGKKGKIRDGTVPSGVRKW